MTATALTHLRRRIIKMKTCRTSTAMNWHTLLRMRYIDDATASTCTNTSFFRLFNGTGVVCNHPNTPRLMATGTCLKTTMKQTLMKTSWIMVTPSPMSRPLRFVLSFLSFPLTNVSIGTP
jgi:hypothetical protein